ncbi:MAG: PilC/PilY family type IV pilus protein [Gammaproteobacteria bacterium]
MNMKPIIKSWLLAAAVATFASMTFSVIPVTVVSAAPPPPLVNISSTPLTVVIPSNPQVLIALTNSNSMDSSDNIIDDSNSPLSIPAATTSARAPSSAIMTWSGANGWPTNTSPVNYQVPAGYAAPITGVTAGSTLYTAPINTYSVAGTGGGGWSCTDNSLNPIITVLGLPLGPVSSLPNPGGNPPTLFFPGSLTWDPTQNWYYNGVNIAGNNGYYEGFDPGPVAAAGKVPSARQMFHGEADEIAFNGNAGLFSVGMGDGGPHTPAPRVGGGGGPPPPPPCGPGSVPFVTCPVIPPPPPRYCHEWKWTATFPTSTPVTPLGDNSASRLNVAKESIAQVIAAYGTQVDFGLMHYKLQSGFSASFTWSYNMSPAGGFTIADFSNVYAAPSAAGEWVINPCWNSNPAGNCGALASQTGLTLVQLKSYHYMLVANSSDDPGVDDVLLAGWSNNYVFMTYGALTDPTSDLPLTSPYLSYSLTNYNCSPSNCPPGTDPVAVNYSSTAPVIPWTGAFTLTPTNSGYAPYSSQGLFSLRGVLWYGNPFSNTGAVPVPVNAAAGPSAAQQAAYLQQFTPYLTPENNVQPGDTGIIPASNPAISYYNFYKSAIFSWATQSPVAGMLSTALNASSWMPAPPPGSCLPSKYVILITDGLPTMDLAGNAWPPPGSAAAAGYGATVAFNGDGTLNAGGTNNQAVIDAINELTALNAAGIKTFVVGMGAGVDPTLNPQAQQVLTAMALAGGTNNYYAATSPAVVVSDLNAILNIISKINVDSVPAAVNSSGLSATTMVYQASYTGYDTPDQDWTGNLQAFSINPDSGVVSTSATWSAQTQLDGQNWDTQRLIATWNPASGLAVPFRWGTISGAQQAELEPMDALGSDRLNYLRGDTSNYAPGGDNFRPRSHILGDIVDSAPLYIAASNGPYMVDPTYQAFAASTTSREPMIYVGANDGMLHAFDANTGMEKFAFIPNGVFANLVNLSNPAYNSSHLYYVDGSPSAGDVKFASNLWHTVLTGGLNDGGQSIYALDVTSPSSIGTEGQLASKVLWEFTDPTLGLTYSQPVIARTNDIASANANPNGFLEFFGSGYNNSDGNDYLYAVNPETGKLVAKINLCAAVGGACSTTIPNGLSGVTVVNSGGNLGLPADTVYTGDLQGNLWKIDISNANPASWVVTLLFQATDSLGNPQPITVTPAVSLQPVPSNGGTLVYFGTGQYLGLPDLSNINTQSFYAIWDNGAGTALRSQLQQQVLGISTVGVTTVRTGTNNAVNWSTQRGWYMDLPLPGERVITNPRLNNGEVVFTTYVPSPIATCSGGGQSFLMAVNYANGGSFPQPQLDINDDGLLNGNDQTATGQNPVGISLGDVYASAPTILSTSYEDIGAMKLTTLSSPPLSGGSNIQNTGERGGQSGQFSWYQIH